jgi:NAD(P)-dependent dehydrogenase (short-subunit alcohol dehydrogenase family)
MLTTFLANSGIGFELAAQLLSKGTYHVLLGSRSVDKGNSALSNLKSLNHPGTAELVHIDVTDDTIITSAFSSVEKNHGKLDILINNAAVAVPPGSLSAQLNTAFATNATGPAVVASTFLPLLQASTYPKKRIVNISSGAGSIGQRLNPSSQMYKMSGAWQYRASKAALSMLSACMEVEYKEHGIRVFAFDPGFTASNLSPHNTAENGARSPDASVRPLVELIEGSRDDEEGKLLHNSGSYPW